MLRGVVNNTVQQRKGDNDAINQQRESRVRELEHQINSRNGARSEIIAERD